MKTTAQNKAAFDQDNPEPLRNDESEKWVRLFHENRKRLGRADKPSIRWPRT